MVEGDLVKSIKFKSIGIVVDVFGDLDPDNPWIRVHFTYPSSSYQWFKLNGLELIKKKEDH